MNLKKMFVATALTATFCVPAFAQNTAIKAKNVKVNVRNETKAPLKLRTGDTHVTVAPGETAKMKVPVGQQIVSDETNSTFNEGAVVATVGESMDGNTVAIR
jgi:hypothetical protein